MDKVIKNKRDLELVTVTLQVTKQVHRNFLVSYILSDQIWWFDIKWFLSHSKNYTCKFMQTNSWHHKLSTSICSFESGNCRKEEEKLQRFEYLEVEKSFFDQIKIIHSFWRAIPFGEKIIIWYKISDTSFKGCVRYICACLFFKSKRKHFSN